MSNGMVIDENFSAGQGAAACYLRVRITILNSVQPSRSGYKIYGYFQGKRISTRGLVWLKRIVCVEVIEERF